MKRKNCSLGHCTYLSLSINNSVLVASIIQYRLLFKFGCSAFSNARKLSSEFWKLGRKVVSLTNFHSGSIFVR